MFIAFSYYNSASNIAYSISNDAQNLHVILKTSDRSSILKILKTGLFVYFDVKGKKRKDVYVLYPVGGMNKKPWTGPAQGFDQSVHFDLQNLLNQSANEAIYSYFGFTEPLKKETGITASLSATINNELVYNLVIPFDRIFNENGWARSNISVGVVSGNFVAPATGGAIVRGTPVGGGEYQYRQVSDANQVGSGLFTPIKIWLQVDLHKEHSNY